MNSLLNNNNKSPFNINLPQSILLELELEKKQLQNIKQQQKTVSSLDHFIKRKNDQIIRLNTLVDKYKPFADKYNQLRNNYTQKAGKIAQNSYEGGRITAQVKLKFANKTKKSEIQRDQLIKQHHQIENFNREIQQIFKLYQQECKNKQASLLKDIQKAYKQVNQLNKKIDEYEIKAFENEQLKSKLKKKQEKERQNSLILQKEKQLINSHLITNQNANNSANYFQKDQILFQGQSNIVNQLRQQIQKLKAELIQKNQELYRSKMLNHQLSIQFDKAVSKICEFQNELSRYRRQNQELKKTFSLIQEKDQYQKIYRQQMLKVSGKSQSNMNQESQQEDSTQNFNYSKQRQKVSYSPKDKSNMKKQ